MRTSVDDGSQPPSLLTGAACALVETPIDFFKSQLQVEVFREKTKRGRLFRSVPHAVTTVLKDRGVQGAYQGLSGAFWRNLPFRSIYFYTYESMLALLRTPHETRADPKVWKVCSLNRLNSHCLSVFCAK